MNEDQIEKIVEQKIDRLDKLLLSGVISQEEYELEIKYLDQWSNKIRFERHDEL